MYILFTGLLNKGERKEPLPSLSSLLKKDEKGQDFTHASLLCVAYCLPWVSPNSFVALSMAFVDGFCEFHFNASSSHLTVTHIRHLDA